jgi:hypothetical protein
MNYRPYIWMGDDQDAHVQAYRNIEVAKAVESGYGYVYGARAKFMLIKPSQITMRADPNLTPTDITISLPDWDLY